MRARRTVSKQAAARNVARLVAPAIAFALAGCWSTGYLTPGMNVKPAFLGVVTKTAYDGASDDLLTAGLGKTGLAAAAAPTPANATAPTAAELRRLAIFNNFARSSTSAQGICVLYG
jgi:hydroxybutyrate-dimer hydrolase